MLTLYVLRHAKSSWAQPLTSDIDRPLNERGRADAPLMGGFIATLGEKPAIVLCSPSRRTRETLNLILPELGAGNVTVHTPDALYPGDAPLYLELLRKLGGQSPCIMLIGHNPATEELAASLSGGGNQEAFVAMRQKYPTAGLAVITFDAHDWSAIAPGKGDLASFTTPAMLKERNDRPD